MTHQTKELVRKAGATALVAVLLLGVPIAGPWPDGPPLLWRSTFLALCWAWLAAVTLSLLRAGSDPSCPPAGGSRERSTPADPSTGSGELEDGVASPGRMAIAAFAGPLWLLLRHSWVLPGTLGPEDLPAALALIGLWPATGLLGELARDLLLITLPWTTFHLLGGLPMASLELGLLGTGVALCALPGGGRAPSRRARACLVGWVLLAMVCRLAPGGTPNTGRIAFDESHGNRGSSLVSSRGATEDPESAQTGMGNLAALLGHWGYRVSRIASWRPGALVDSDVLVLGFPTQRYSAAERAEIRAFLERGGGLLAVGEHTNMAGVMEALNPVLEEAGLALGYDTVWLDGAQRDRLAHASHPLALGAMHLNVANGASVSYWGSRAWPLLAARWGVWADAGDPRGGARSFLGDSKHDPRAEPSRDLALTAASSVGRGRVLLLGDTGYLQNGGLYDSPQTARAIFYWLNRPEILPVSLPVLRLAVTVIAAAGAMLLLLAGAASRVSVCQAVAGALAGVQLLTTLALPADFKASPPRLPGAFLVDQSHAESLALYHRRRKAGGESLDSLMSVLQSAGYFPRLHFRGRLDAIPISEVAGVLLPAPRVELSAKEAAWCLAVADAGGTCVAVADPAYPQALAPLLAPMGVAVGALPAAARKPIASEGVVSQVPSGPLPVELEGTGPLARLAGFTMARPFELTGTQGAVPGVVARYAGAPVLIELRRGRGSVIALADPELLQSRSLDEAPAAVAVPRREAWRRLLGRPRSDVGARGAP
ncbi:MAG: hypothetical protein HY816_01965 [Candidatus Wallbacteria bacterium]|nr:hypothetical protein [Candidatus Wallbacteria bacterium]